MIHRSLHAEKSNLKIRQNGGSRHFHETRVNYLIRSTSIGPGNTRPSRRHPDSVTVLKWKSDGCLVSFLY